MIAAIIIVAVIAALIVAVCVRGAWENHALQCNPLTVEDEKLPAAFDGLRIAHISDLHNTRFGKDQQNLIGLLREEKPDLIVVTGDLIDKRRPGMRNALDFAAQAVRIAPVCYVPGNHEAASAEYPELRMRLAGLGLILLEDRALPYKRGEGVLTLMGVADPRMCVPNENAAIARCMQEKLAAVTEGAEGYQVLLAHRPETLTQYAQAGIDLAFCGHAHGGQFRLPWGGVIAPNQGFFPKITAGIYRQGGTQMVVSRGLGNSWIPIRLFNRPEVLLVTLRRAKTPVSEKK